METFISRSAVLYASLIDKMSTPIQGPLAIGSLQGACLTKEWGVKVGDGQERHLLRDAKGFILFMVSMPNRALMCRLARVHFRFR